MFKGVILAEGEFEGTVEFETQAELDAYAAGLSKGANLYGAGGCGLWTEGEYLDLVECADSKSTYDAHTLAVLKKYFGH